MTWRYTAQAVAAVLVAKAVPGGTTTSSAASAAMPVSAGQAAMAAAASSRSIPVSMQATRARSMDMVAQGAQVEGAVPVVQDLTGAVADSPETVASEESAALALHFPTPESAGPHRCL